MRNINLKLAILKCGKKSFEVTREAGLHPSVLSHYVNEHYEAPQEHKKAIARALGSTVGDLFQDSEATVDG
jgi:hypothetical protein